MSSLYELTGQIASLKLLFEEGEIDEQTLADTMESLDADIELKAEGYAKIIANFDGDILLAKSEINRLSTFKQIAENNIIRLKNNLMESMIAQGKQKIKAGTFTVTIAKNAPSVNVIDEDTIPKKYFNIPLPILSKKDLLADLKALKEGEAIPGAELKQGESLRIK